MADESPFFLDKGFKKAAVMFLMEHTREAFQEAMAIRCSNQGHVLDSSGIAHDDYKPTCVWCFADMTDSLEWKAVLAMKDAPDPPSVHDDSGPEDVMADMLEAMTQEQYEKWIADIENYDETDEMIDWLNQCSHPSPEELVKWFDRTPEEAQEVFNKWKAGKDAEQKALEEV